MRYKLLLLVLTLVPVSLMAQKNVPGFMGKRWNLQYQINLWPSALNPNSEELPDPASDGNYVPLKMSINVRHNLEAGYSISKKYDLIANFTYSTTNIDLFGVSNSIYGLDVSSLYYPGLRATGFSVGVRKHKKHFAPLGYYVSYKVGYTFLSYDDITYKTDDYGYPPNTQHTISGGTTGAPVVGMGFGVNRVIAGDFILNYGLDINLFLGGIGNWNRLLDASAPDELYIDDGNTSVNQEAYRKRAAGRYCVQNLFGMRLGIGYLL